MLILLIKSLISILLKDFYAVINHCRNISEKFPVLRGCRQGDPSSPYLFILACEFLAHKIRSETGIEGFSFFPGNQGNHTANALYPGNLHRLSHIHTLVSDLHHLQCIQTPLPSSDILLEIAKYAELPANVTFQSCS